MSETRQLIHVVQVRVSADDLAAIRAKAQAAGLSVSGFLRAAALERKIVPRPPELLTGLANLGRLGGLLKLALTKIDGGSMPADLRGQVEATLAAIRNTAGALQDAIA